MSESTWPPSTRPFRSSPPEGAVGIVLPIRDDLRFFKLCFHSLLNFTDYRFMLTVVDNMSCLRTRQYLDSVRKNHNVNVLSYQKEHNLSAEWNLGLRYMFSFETVKFGVCLTPTIVTEPYWLSSFVRSMPMKDHFYAPKTNAGMDHVLGFAREAYDTIGGFDEKLDPVIDAAQRVGVTSLKDVYVHKFKINNFDPRRTDSERQETTEAKHANA